MSREVLLIQFDTRERLTKALLQEALRDVLVTAAEACGPQQDALSGSHELDELRVPW